MASSKGSHYGGRTKVAIAIDPLRLSLHDPEVRRISGQVGFSFPFSLLTKKEEEKVADDNGFNPSS